MKPLFFCLALAMTLTACEDQNQQPETSVLQKTATNTKNKAEDAAKKINELNKTKQNIIEETQ